MNLFLMIVIFGLSSTLASGAVCCLGGGPKTFVDLQHLQKYKLGLSTSFRDIYGRYDSYGDLVSAEKSQTYNMSLAATTNMADGLDVFFVLPWVYQKTSIGNESGSAASIGDVVIGSKYTLIDRLFIDDWYPIVTLLGGMKFPTGATDSVTSSGKLSPGTGNGIWEPFFGITLRKELAPIQLGLSATYTRRFKSNVPNPSGNGVLAVKEGDRFELTESGTLPVSWRLKFVLGSTQQWDLSREIDRATVPDSRARDVRAFLASTYTFTQYWSVSVTGEGSLPVAKLGVNQDASRTLTFATTYGFY